MPKSESQLTALDEAFLANERAGAHLHVGAVFICGGPAPSHAAFIERLAARLHRVPRYRQRLIYPPLALGRPAWVDDPEFELEYHVRRTALPAPGSLEDVRRLAARVFSQRLDRTKSLWELWVVEGLADGRWAMINKTHHAMVDGVAGMDVTTALFDLEPEPEDVDLAPAPWEPREPPSPFRLAAAAVGDRVRRPVALGVGALGALASPERALGHVKTGLAGVAEVTGAMLDSEPRSVLNGAPSAHRRFAWTTHRLSEFKVIKDACGGTVNDVYIAAVTGALRTFLIEHGSNPGASKLRAMIPVSVRTDAERGALGNRIAGVSTTLPVDVPTARGRLEAVSARLTHLKQGNMAVGAGVVAGLQELAPPTILAQASRLQFSSRLYNLLISNVPGPQFPVFINGRELETFVPVAFLGPDKRVAVVAASYNGAMTVSVLTSRDHLGPPGRLTELIGEELDQLLTIAQS